MLGYTAGEITKREPLLERAADFGMDDVCCWNSDAYLTCLTMFEIVQIIILGLLGQNLKPITLDLFTPHFLDSRTVSEVTVIVVHN